MNEQPNTQPPKKSFWAKLFGGKDNNTTASAGVSPVPAAVPPTDSSQNMSDGNLPATPPPSQFSAVPEVPVSVPEQITTASISSTPGIDSVATSPVVEPSSNTQVGPPTPLSTVEFNETSPLAADVSTQQVPQETPIAPPPSDPMVTPVSPVSAYDQMPVATEPLPSVGPYESPAVPSDDPQVPQSTPTPTA